MTDIPIKECPECYRELPFTIKLWGGKTYDGSVCKQCADEARKQSRADANLYRDEVLNRAKGLCEICNLYCSHIMVVHHIVHVADGGNGTPDNLIGLCPNCHANVHYYQTYAGRDMGVEDDRHPLAQWYLALQEKSKFSMCLFDCVSGKTASCHNGTWYSGNETIQSLSEKPPYKNEWN